MKIILKKEESSTSVLLFIFNIIYSRTQKESLHLSSILEIMEKFGKSESATRMALSRACKSNILSTHRVGKDVVYSINSKALSHINTWNLNARYLWQRLSMRKSDWNHNWHMVNISISDFDKRDLIDERIQQFAYVRVDAQTWVGPYQHLEEIKSVLNELAEDTNLISITGALDSNLDIERHLMNKYRLAQLYPLYENFNQTYQTLLIDIEDDQTILSNGNSLSILHKLGYAYFGIASNDPMLPQSILPNWPGDQAAELMQKLRTHIEAYAWDYLKNFD